MPLEPLLKALMFVWSIAALVCALLWDRDWIIPKVEKVKQTKPSTEDSEDDHDDEIDHFIVTEIIDEDEEE